MRAPARPRVRGASALSAKVPAGLLPHNILHLLQVLAREALPGVGARLFAHGEREKPGNEDGEKRERERQREEREKEKGQPVGNEILFGLTCSARRTFFAHWRIVGSCRRPTRRCSCPCPSLRRRRDEKKKRLVVFERKRASGRGPRQERVRSVLPIISFPSPPPHSSRGGGWREKERERGGVRGVGGVDARLTLAREQVFWFQTKALDVRERDELGLSGGKVVPLDLHPLVRYLYVLVLVQQAHRALLYGLSDLSLGSPPPPHPSWKNFGKVFLHTPGSRGE